MNYVNQERAKCVRMVCNTHEKQFFEWKIKWSLSLSPLPPPLLPPPQVMIICVWVFSFSSHPNPQKYYLYRRCMSWWCCSKPLKNDCGKDKNFWPILRWVVHCQWFVFFFCFARLNIVPIEWWFQEQISEGKLVLVLKFNPKSTITNALKFISPRFRRSTRSSALEISWVSREPFDTAHETYCRHCVCSCVVCQHTSTRYFVHTESIPNEFSNWFLCFYFIFVDLFFFPNPCEVVFNWQLP